MNSPHPQFTRCEPTLLAYVLEELDARKGSWPKICADVPGIDYSWLCKLAQKRIDDPSVNKIQLLADYFRGIEREREAA